MKWTLVESPRIGRFRRMQLQVDGRVCGFVSLTDEEHADLERRFADRLPTPSEPAPAESGNRDR